MRITLLQLIAIVLWIIGLACTIDLMTRGTRPVSLLAIMEMGYSLVWMFTTAIIIVTSERLGLALNSFMNRLDKIEIVKGD
jgi:hypothetical protein